MGAANVQRSQMMSCIMVAAALVRDPTAGAGELAQRLCRFAVNEMALSGALSC
jgi:hypothetical protein